MITRNSVLLVTLCSGLLLTSLFASPVLGEENACQTFEKRITRFVSDKNYREVFAAISDYENHLVSQYKPSRLEDDTFQSEAEHLSVTLPFEGWKEVELPELTEMGPAFRILFCLESSSGPDDGRVCLLRVSVGVILQRFAGEELNIFGDKELTLIAQIMASQVGVAKDLTVRNVGPYRVAISDLAGGLWENPICMAVFFSNDRLYVLFAGCKEGLYEKNKKDLLATIETMKFDVRLPDKRRIDKILDKKRKGDSVTLCLERVRELSEIGEYDAAMKELEDLRSKISSLLPPPKIRNNTFIDEAYGISLKNPHPKEMTLKLEDIGNGQKVIGLLENEAVEDRGIAITVMDLDRLYGAQFTDYALAQGIRPLLSSMGRGSAMFTGRLMGEKFIKVNGHTAYQAEVETRIPRTSFNILVIDHGRTPILVMMIIDSSKYEQKLEEYMKIIQQIELRTAKDNEQAKEAVID